jgi:hypothetical protein
MLCPGVWDGPQAKGPDTKGRSREEHSEWFVEQPQPETERSSTRRSPSVKNNTWVSSHTALKMSLLCSALFLCSFRSLTSMAVTHAMGLKCPSHAQRCAPTPSPTSLSAPTPIAPQLPKGTPSPYPTRVTQPISARTAGTPPVTPTNTSASATATTLSITPNQTTITGTDATRTSQQSRGTEDQGLNLLLPSLGVGAPFFLLSGALLWFLWRRQTNQHKPALRGLSRTAQTSPWTSSREIQPPFALPELVSSGAFVPRVTGASGVSPEFESTQPMPFLQLADTPSDPMTTAFAQSMLTMSLDNTLSSPQNGTFHSQLIASFNLPLQPTEARGSNKSGRTVFPLAFPPMAEMGASPPSLSSPLSGSPVLPVTVCPPAIKDDLVLADTMRQAQMGLFVLPGRERSLQASSSHV